MKNEKELCTCTITQGEAELLTYLKELNTQGLRIQLSLHPTRDWRGEQTIRRTPTNICKVEANTTPRYRSFEEISEGFYDDCVDIFHS